VRLAWLVVLASAMATAAGAQTGPVATVPDNSDVLTALAVIALIAGGILLVALFEPWTWGKKKRRK